MTTSPLDLPVSNAPTPGFGLGLAALGRPAYLNLGHGRDLADRQSRDRLRVHAHGVLDAAWNGGIRYFDAARSYGLAEAFLGDWLRLRRIPQGEVAIGSKWGYRYTAEWDPEANVHEVKDHSLAMLERQWTETRAELGDHLDLYQIHSVTPDSGVLDDTAVLERLAGIANEGTSIGLSVSGPHQASVVERALELTGPDGRPLFATVQATWNLLEPSAGPALAAAAAAGLLVIIKEALANGRLTNRDEDLAARLVELAPGHPPDSIALAAAHQQPWASIVLSGASTAAQLDDNLEAKTIEIDLRRAADEFSETATEYWDYRQRLDWT